MLRCHNFRKLHKNAIKNQLEFAQSKLRVIARLMRLVFCPFFAIIEGAFSYTPKIAFFAVMEFAPVRSA